MIKQGDLRKENEKYGSDEINVDGKTKCSLERVTSQGKENRRRYNRR